MNRDGKRRKSSKFWAIFLTLALLLSVAIPAAANGDEIFTSGDAIGRDDVSGPENGTYVHGGGYGF
ncbi:MAG: hypothetical protein LBL63_03335 [Clostridiales Family XIII bacterium]|jgi:hypothetical protein|nr:hypothetical protein [Clostridiales Family XIII bacterium]